MGKYFYNEASSVTVIKKLENDYGKIVETVNNLGRIVYKYTCMDNYWFDDNAIVFAEWWNDNDKDKDSTGGNLVWDEEAKRLIINSHDVKADGSDRLKHMVNIAGKVFYVAVCKSLEALESSHKDVKNKLNKYLKAAHDKSYTLDTATVGKRWLNFMEGLGCETYNFTILKTPANANGKTTNLAEVKNFQREVSTTLQNLEEHIETYCKHINELANNIDSSKWWGFSDDVRSKVKQATSSYQTKATRKIKNFKQNLNLALTKTIEAKDGDLKILTDLNSVNFD